MLNTEVNDFIVASDSEVWKDSKISTEYLLVNHCYKTLSLVEALRAHIQVPPTLLLLKMNQQIIDYVIERWGLPLMIRMDYKSLPPKKTLGGIPLFTRKSTLTVAEFLFDTNCFPLFHCHLDRFEDIYSVGIMMSPNDHLIQIEVVGKAFDASDLRLGQAISHEHIEIDASTLSIFRRSRISHNTYLKERKRRSTKILRLREYIKYVDQNGRLLSSSEFSDIKCPSEPSYANFIPSKYIPLPNNLLDHLIEIIGVLHTHVIRMLPYSKAFVASLSYHGEKKWTLWDIYGHWYKR